MGIFIRMLLEGVVNIPPQEEKAIDAMVKALERFYKRHSDLYKNASSNAICAALKNHTNDVLAPKYKLNSVFWRFIYEPDNGIKAGYIPSLEGDGQKEVFINLAHNVSNRFRPLRIQKIDWDGVAESIYHEWVHVKQDIEIQKKQYKGMATPALRKMYKATAYHDIKWEQMALARGEIEWIKRNLKKVKPQQIIKWLQQNGLMSPETIMIQKGNPTAYKRILKYAIMFMLKTMAQRATLS
mgnify:FL=1